MEKKYILTDEVKTIYAHTLHRIKAVKDFGDVKAGDLGGWVESEENLSHEGLCWVGGEAWVFQNAQVYGDATVYGHAHVYGTAQVYGCAFVSDYAEIFENAQIYDHACVYGEIFAYGDSKIHERAHLCGRVKVGSNANIYGSVKLHCLEKILFDGCIKSENDVLCLGPIGSRHAYTTFYRTNKRDIWVSCGCFNGNIEDFERRVKQMHESTLFGKQYLAAIHYAKTMMALE